MLFTDKSQVILCHVDLVSCCGWGSSRLMSGMETLNSNIIKY